MSKLKIAVLAAGVMLAAPVLASEPGPYVGLGLGLHMPRNSDVDIGGIPTDMKFGDGFGVLGAVGYKSQRNVRTEFELGYQEANVGEVGGVEWNGAQKTTTAMINALFELANTSRFSPYIGAGLGIGWVGWKENFGPTGGPTYNGSESEFAFQGIAGINVPVSDQLDMFLEYRYVGINNLNYAANNAAASPVAGDHDARSNNIYLGIRYAFNGPVRETAAAAAPPPPPPPQPAPPAPPPPPPVPQKFIVFFDFDRSDLRTDAQRIVAEAAEYAKTTGKSVINATGHADTSGTPAYNLALSERRATAVKAELQRLGFSENEIVVTWKGESEPLVQTGDGVREPQNRRVEIVLE